LFGRRETTVISSSTYSAARPVAEEPRKLINTHAVHDKVNEARAKYMTLQNATKKRN
jgi:hypothetical protein